jgi:transposase-like protein
MRNLLAHIPKRDKALVAAAVRTVFVMADRDDANEQLTGVAEALQRRYPKAADLLVEAEADILAYMAFPQGHWRRIYSTNPLE